MDTFSKDYFSGWFCFLGDSMTLDDGMVKPVLLCYAGALIWCPSYWNQYRGVSPIGWGNPTHYKSLPTTNNVCHYGYFPSWPIGNGMVIQVHIWVRQFLVRSSFFQKELVTQCNWVIQIVSKCFDLCNYMSRICHLLFLTTRQSWCP